MSKKSSSDVARSNNIARLNDLTGLTWTQRDLEDKGQLDFENQARLADEIASRAALSYRKWARSDERTTLRLYRLLAQLYVDAGLIASQPLALSRLVHHVVSVTAGSSSLTASELRNRKPDDLLLFLILGADKASKVTKSQWLAALRNAEAEGVARDEEALVAWIVAKGGIIKAGQRNGADESSVFSMADFSRRADSEPAGKDRPVVELAAGTALHDGFALLLVWAGDEPTRATVLATIAEPKLVEAAAKAAESSEARSQADLDKALWWMNRYALKVSSSFRWKKARNSDFIGFDKGLRLLQGRPEADRFFDGEPGWSAIVDSLQDVEQYEVLNPGFADIDPGRYVRNARPGALIGFAYDPDSDWEQAAGAYISAHKRQEPESAEAVSSEAEAAA